MRAKNLHNEKYEGYVAADDANGSGKFKIDNIIKSFAPVFVPNSTTTVAGQAYMYKDLLYVAKVSGYQGPWDASKFTETSVSSDDYQKSVAQRTLAGNVAPAFDPTRLNDEGGAAYYEGQRVVNDGKLYLFIANKNQGPWVGQGAIRITEDQSNMVSLGYLYQRDFVTYVPEGSSNTIDVTTDGFESLINTHKVNSDYLLFTTVLANTIKGVGSNDICIEINNASEESITLQVSLAPYDGSYQVKDVRTVEIGPKSSVRTYFDDINQWASYFGNNKFKICVEQQTDGNISYSIKALKKVAAYPDATKKFVYDNIGIVAQSSFLKYGLATGDSLDITNSADGSLTVSSNKAGTNAIGFTSVLAKSLADFDSNFFEIFVKNTSASDIKLRLGLAPYEGWYQAKDTRDVLIKSGDETSVIFNDINQWATSFGNNEFKICVIQLSAGECSFIVKCAKKVCVFDGSLSLKSGTDVVNYVQMTEYAVVAPAETDNTLDIKDKELETLFGAHKVNGQHIGFTAVLAPTVSDFNADNFKMFVTNRGSQELSLNIGLAKYDGWYLGKEENRITIPAGKTESVNYCDIIARWGEWFGSAKFKIYVEIRTNGESLFSVRVLKDSFVNVGKNSAYDKIITCWGDSLTYQGGWTDIISAKSGLPLKNCGVGGETSKMIMARQGGDVMVVNDITIPANTSTVEIGSSIGTFFGNSVTPLRQPGGQVNPCNLCGVMGTLSYTSSKYYFARLSSGTAVSVERPSALKTWGDIAYNEPYLMIIFMGQNGGWSSNEEIVRQHKYMIAHAHPRHFIVLGLSSGTTESRASYELAMKTEFGRYFVSIREYLTHPIYNSSEEIISCYGLADAGLTPTADDLAKIAIGQVPSQLLADAVHYTDATKTVIGNMLFKYLQELGIF